MEHEKEYQTCIKPEQVTEEDARLRAMHMLQILQQETDEDHPISTSRLTQMMLERYGTKMHRTKVPSDLSAISAGGYDVRAVRTQVYSYYYDGWEFDVPELKMLIDAVQAARFIPEKRSQELVEKLTAMTRKWHAGELRRSATVVGRIRTDASNIYYIVDALSQAINKEKKVSILYFSFNSRKKKELTNDGEPYVVSPYNLVWNGDYYYLIGYCDNRDEMRTFRIDRILSVPEVLDIPAEKKPKGYRVTRYTNDSFRMFANQEPQEIVLICREDMMNAIIDKFGKGVKTAVYGDGAFSATANVCVSPNFYRWVFGFGGAIRIQSPAAVKEEYHKMLQEALKNNSI